MVRDSAHSRFISSTSVIALWYTCRFMCLQVLSIGTVRCQSNTRISLSRSHCFVYPLPYTWGHCPTAATNRVRTKPVQLVEGSLVECQKTAPFSDFFHQMCTVASPHPRPPPPPSDDTPPHVCNLGQCFGRSKSKTSV